MIIDMRFLFLISCIINCRKTDPNEKVFRLITQKQIEKYEIIDGDEKTYKIDFTNDTDTLENIKKFENQKGFLMPYLYEIKIHRDSNSDPSDLLYLDLLDKKGEVVYSIEYTSINPDNNEVAFVIKEEYGGVIKIKTSLIYIEGDPVQAIIADVSDEIMHRLDLIVKFSSILWINSNFITNSENSDVESLMRMLKFIFNCESLNFDKDTTLCLNQTLNIFMSRQEFTRICTQNLLYSFDKFDKSDSNDYEFKRRIFFEAVHKIFALILDGKIIEKKESSANTLDWLLSEIKNMTSKLDDKKNEPINTSEIDVDENYCDAIKTSNLQDAIILFSELTIKSQCKHFLDMNDTFFQIIYPSKNNLEETPESVDEIKVYDMSERNYYVHLFHAMHTKDKQLMRNLRDIRNNPWGEVLKINEVIHRLSVIEGSITTTIDRLDTIKDKLGMSSEVFYLKFMKMELKKDLEKCKASLKEFSAVKDKLHNEDITTLNQIFDKILEKDVPDPVYTRHSYNDDDDDYYSKKPYSDGSDDEDNDGVASVIIYIVIFIILYIIIYYIKKRFSS